MISVGGAIIIATYTGRVIPLPWTNKSKNKPLIKGQLQKNTIVGIIYCIIGVSSLAAYTILLAKTLPQYPAPLTLTTGTCLVGALINFTVAQVLGSRYGSRWMIDWNIMFLSYFYAGLGSWLYSDRHITDYLGQKQRKEFPTSKYSGADAPLGH